MIKIRPHQLELIILPFWDNKYFQRVTNFLSLLAKTYPWLAKMQIFQKMPYVCPIHLILKKKLAYPHIDLLFVNLLSSCK